MMTSLGGGKWQCIECSYVLDATNVKYHLEAKHFGSQFTYQCQYCDTNLPNRKALNNHMYRKHRANK